MSSLEKPRMNASCWSISVTSNSSASCSESKVLSSSPPNAAPRITTWRFIHSACSGGPDRQNRRYQSDPLKVGQGGSMVVSHRPANDHAVLSSYIPTISDLRPGGNDDRFVRALFDALGRPSR